MARSPSAPCAGGSLEREAVLVGIDAGTTKVTTLIGEVGRAGDVNVIGYGIAPSAGMKKGMVANIDQTVNSIASSVEKAERLSGYKISSAFVAVGGIAHQQPELARRRRRLRAQARGEPRGRRPRDRGGQGGPGAIEPRDPARRAARLHRRRPGGHQGPARHERGAARGRDPHRGRRRDLGPEPEQVRRPTPASRSTRW